MLVIISIVFIGGTAVAVTSGQGVAGALASAGAAILSVPMAWLGQGLKKIRVPVRQIPGVLIGVGTIIGTILGKKLGGEQGAIVGGWVGSQAGMMSPYAHDQGWHNNGKGLKKFAGDVSSVVKPPAKPKGDT